MKLTKLAILAGLALFAAACAAPTGSSSNYNNASGGHDGTSDAPVSLALGTPYSGKVGAYSNVSNSESYYQFDAGSNTQVMLSITGASVPHPGSGSGSNDYWTHLYSNADFSSGYVGSPVIVDGVSPIFTGLTNATYYLSVLNRLDQATTYQIKAEALPASINEGSTGSPTFLTLGSNRASYTANLSGGKSYYVFNTGTHTSVTATYGLPLLDSSLYTTNSYAFGDLVDWEYSLSSSTMTYTGLTTNTDYYLSVENGESDAALVNFTLTLTGN